MENKDYNENSSQGASETNPTELITECTRQGSLKTPKMQQDARSVPRIEVDSEIDQIEVQMPSILNS